MERSIFSEIVRSVTSGGPGFCQIAVTNACNASCKFCSFSRLDKAEWVMASRSRVAEALDVLGARGVEYVVFVGGEPLMHPELVGIVADATERGLNPLICTNASLLRPELIWALKEAGLKNIIISIDAPDANRHDENRGIKGLSERIRRANEELARAHVASTASVTMSRLIDDYGKLPAFLKALGFSRVTFSYPLTYLGSSYLSFSGSPLIDYTKEELIAVFSKVKELKKEIPVLNPSESLEEMIRTLRGERPRFPCLAGYKYFFVDWNLDVYRCHFVKEPMCNIRDFGQAELIRDGCTRCMIDCYRDPSVLQYIAVSLSDFMACLRRGEYLKALGHLTDPNNLRSLKCVIEERKWIADM